MQEIRNGPLHIPPRPQPTLIPKGFTMTEKTASVHWAGRGKKGQGQISTETEALERYPYGFASRFADDRRGTNPEEILGAAHAACFTVAFSFACDKAGFATPRSTHRPACVWCRRATGSSSTASHRA